MQKQARIEQTMDNEDEYEDDDGTVVVVVVKNDNEPIKYLKYTEMLYIYYAFITKDVRCTYNVQCTVYTIHDGGDGNIVDLSVHTHKMHIISEYILILDGGAIFIPFYRDDDSNATAQPRKAYSAF